MKKTMLILLIAVLSTSIGSAQSIKTERMLFAWKNMKKMVVNSAKEMPEEYFDFTPAKGLRNFGEQINYINRANRIFISKLAGKNQKSAKATLANQVTGKDAIIKDLEASFDYIIATIPRIKGIDQNIILFGQKMSKTEGLLFMADYLNQQHGKIIVYMRMKGIEPPKSTSWLQ